MRKLTCCAKREKEQWRHRMTNKETITPARKEESNA